MNKNTPTERFAALALPHLDAAYNLARWLTRNDHDAEDLVQAAYARALKFFPGFRGEDARAWLLTIVRNTYFTSLRDARHEKDDVVFDEALHGESPDGVYAGSAPVDPQARLLARERCGEVNAALARLPSQFREALILKEMEDLSYKEIADMTEVPIGTVMSRLARARKLLAAYLQPAQGESNGL